MIALSARRRDDESVAVGADDKSIAASLIARTRGRSELCQLLGGMMTPGFICSACDIMTA